MEKKVIKKGYKLAALLCLILLMVLLSCGCGDGQGESRIEGADPDFKADDSLITELYSEDGSYKDRDGVEYTYSYHVPQIVSDNPGAKTINERIAEKYGTYVEYGNDAMKEGYGYSFPNISWERYWHGSRLFLKISTETFGWSEFDIICYDFAADMEVEPEEIIADLGVSEEEWTSALRKASVHEFDKEFTDNINRRNYYNNGVQELRARLISEGFVNLERQVYINDKDEVIVIVPILSPAGAGYYYRELVLPLNGYQGKNMKVTDSFITAELKDGKLTLTFEENQDSRDIFSGLKTPPGYGKAYEVDGIYDDYQDMIIAYLGNNINPYLFLLTNDGRVEFVNIIRGIEYGYYCSGGTLPKTVGKTGLEAGVVNDGQGGGYHTAYAAGAEGKKKELSEGVYAAENAVPGMLTNIPWHTEVKHSTDGGGSYTGHYWVDFSDDHSLTIENAYAEGAMHTEYNGSYDCLGMTDEGLIVTWTVKEKGNKKNTYKGVWALNNDMDGLFIMAKGGINFFDAQEGAPTAFTESFG